MAHNKSAVIEQEKNVALRNFSYECKRLDDLIMAGRIELLRLEGIRDLKHFVRKYCTEEDATQLQITLVDIGFKTLATEEGILNLKTFYL